MFDKLLALSMFFILKTIILLPQGCQRLSPHLDLVRSCSGAAGQLSWAFTSLPSVDQHEGISTASLELFRFISIKDTDPALR